MDPPGEQKHLGGRGWVIAVALILCSTALLVHLAPVLRPVLFGDDFEIIQQSNSWEITQANLWVPANEHIMPLGRVSTWLMIVVAQRPSNLPLVMALQGPLAVLLGMVLVYLFVRRELDHPVYGLIAMGLFGITAHYDQAVNWFAASFAILALDTVLLALLAAQRWRQGGNIVHLILSAVWSVLAPCWFASGILAGPLATLYLLTPSLSRDQFTFRGESARNVSGILWKVVLALAPALAGGAFLAGVRYSKNYQHIMKLEHYRFQNKTMAEAFELDKGLVSTARSLVDNLLPGVIGFESADCPLTLVPGLLLALAAVGLLWAWFAPSLRLVVLGLALILVSYVLVYSARAGWNYETQLRHWGRYQLFPHLGLVLFFCGGLPRFRHWLLPDEDDPEVPARVLTVWLVLAGLMLLLFPCQLPRTWGPYFAKGQPYHSVSLWQTKDLMFVEEVDDFCQSHGIAAETARKVLPPFQITWSSDNSRDGWRLLHGSDDPRPLSEDEARQLLRPYAERVAK